MNIIQNKTKISKKDMLQFLSHASSQNVWLVAICAVIVALLGFSVQNGALVYQNFFYLIGGALIVIIYYAVVFATYSKQTKNFHGIENEYIFSDDGFSVVGTTEGVTEKFDMKYHSLFKVKETKSHIYLFVNNYSALIMSKNNENFSHGDVDKLRKFLELKLTAKQNHLKKTK